MATIDTRKLEVASVHPPAAPPPVRRNAWKSSVIGASEGVSKPEKIVTGKPGL